MTEHLISEQELLDLQDFLTTTAFHPDANSGDLAKTRALAEDTCRILQRPISILIAGDYSSAKSTLTGILADDQLIPPTTMQHSCPPLIFLYGRAPSSSAEWWDSRVRTKINHVDYDGLVVLDPDFIAIQAPNRFLKNVNIFDITGKQSSQNYTGQLQKMAKLADVIIWCADATQGWNKSEEANWAKLPNIPRENTILAVTHTHPPLSETDFEQTVQRLKKDTGSVFGTIIPVATAPTRNAVIPGVVQDNNAWAESSGIELISKILEIGNTIRNTAIARTKIVIDQYLNPSLGTYTSEEKLDTMDEDPKVEQVPDSALLANWLKKIDTLLSITENAEDLVESSFLQESSNALMEISEDISEPGVLDDETAWLLDQFYDAMDMLILMQLEDGEEPIECATAVLLQVSRDLNWITTRTGY